MQEFYNIVKVWLFIVYINIGNYAVGSVFGIWPNK